MEIEIFTDYLSDDAYVSYRSNRNQGWENIHPTFKTRRHAYRVVHSRYKLKQKLTDKYVRDNFWREVWQCETV